MPSSSQPLLPVEFVQQVEANPMMSKFRSEVYTKEAHKDRLRMRDWSHPLSPDYVVISPDPTVGFTKDAGRTSVHAACFRGDVLQVFELLRCGATADQTDEAGISPLHLALLKMSTLKSLLCAIVQYEHLPSVQREDGTLWEQVDFTHAMSQYIWVARILIEQHADVNREVGGISILHLACQSANWEIISLLLEHGATPHSSLSSCFTSQADEMRLSTLIRANPPSRHRPPRVCPCWSGKMIPDCHGKEPRPYPLHFICVCGSGKTYDRCCSRKTPVIEEWNKDLQRIIHGFDTTPDRRFPESNRQLLRAIRTRIEQFTELGALFGVKFRDNPTGISAQQGDHPARVSAKAGNPARLRKASALLLSRGQIDPAFAYALCLSGSVPRPSGRNYSRKICEEIQASWNTLVDKYIIESNDVRLKIEIERAAKIGIWKGALIRVCEGDGCMKSEGKDITFKCCSKCKMSVYCSASCQKSAWKSHKPMCGSDDQCVQALPSQEALFREIFREGERAFQEYERVVPLSVVSSMIQSLKQELS